MTMENGFSLLELMVVIAIIGILTTFALPAYQTHTARAQLTEALTLADGLKTSLLTQYMQLGTCPDNDTAAQGSLAAANDISGRYVARMHVHTIAATQCGITATFKSTAVAQPLQGHTLTLYFETSGDDQAATTSYKWQCSSDIAARYLPRHCTTASQQ